MAGAAVPGKGLEAPLGGSSSLWVLLASYWGGNTLWGKCGEKVWECK